MTVTKASAYTLEQVRDLLDKVAAHPRLGKRNVAEILKKLGGDGRLPVEGETGVRDLKPKYYDRIFQHCEEVLAAQPSEKDEELIAKIDDAVKAEAKATSVVTERGVELGKLLIEAFRRYPTERPFRKFLQWTAFTTYKRAADLMFAAGGMKEGEELQRLLKRGADNTRKSRDRNKPAAITKPNVIAPPTQPRITDSNVMSDDEARARFEEPMEPGLAAIIKSLPLGATETIEPPAVEPSHTVKRSEKSVRQSHEAALQMLGPTPWDQFKVAVEILMPLMNVPTRGEARKLVSAVSNKADMAERKAA